MQSMHFIGNDWFAGTTVMTFDCVDPATGQVFATLPAGGASDGPKRVSLELGGKNPVVVFDDMDIEAAVKRVADAPDAGITWQNCNNMVVIQAPWGGVKKSGMGRELGRRELERFLEPKQKTRWLPGGGLGCYDIPATAAE